MPTLVVTGAGGLLGGRLLQAAAGRYRVFPVYHHSPASMWQTDEFVGDLTDGSEIERLASHVTPEIIINCAALADVDRCEREPQVSDAINRRAVELLVEAFPAARFVQLSTDYVFPGGTPPPGPQDPPQPLNMYGRHKLAAERAVAKSSPRHLVIRAVTIIDHTNKRNFFRFVFDALRRGETIQALTDQISNPITARDAADIIMRLIEKKVSGLVHIGGREFVSRYELAVAIADHFGLDKRCIGPRTSADVSRPAPRPLAAGLDCRQTEALLGRAMPTLAQGFGAMLKELSD